MKKLSAWQTLQEKIIYNTPWCTVKEETVKLPNGEIVSDYSIVEFRDVAMVFPLTKDNEVIMVRQYRHGIRKILLELPAGTYNKDKESPEDAVKRELQEETGYRVEKVVLLGTAYEYPTKDRHSIHMYFADDLTYEPINFKEATEEVELVKIPLSKLDMYIQTGAIAVTGTITAIHLAKEYLKNK
jgi:ADP-ribose pyrophosphatase